MESHLFLADLPRSYEPVGADVRRRAARFTRSSHLVTSGPTILAGSWEAAVLSRNRWQELPPRLRFLLLLLHQGRLNRRVDLRQLLDLL